MDSKDSGGLFGKAICGPQTRLWPSLVQCIEETTTLISSPPGLGPSNKNKLHARGCTSNVNVALTNLFHIQRSQLHLSHISAVSHLTFPVQVMKDICIIPGPLISWRAASAASFHLIFSLLDYKHYLLFFMTIMYSYVGITFEASHFWCECSPNQN